MGELVSRDLLEKTIVVSIVLGVFLPLRLLVNVFVSEHWLGSIGLITALTLLFTILIKKNKLGRLGKLLERQMLKSINGKTGKIIIISCVIFLIYFSSTLILIERANSIYVDDKEQFYFALKNGFETNPNFLENVNGPNFNSEKQIPLFSSLDYSISISYAVLNDLSDGWVEHLFVVLLIEQIEVFSIFVLYRRLNLRLTPKTV